MIKDKEYPATHSMMTSWYAIDLDGNVAILEFGHNGPVPQCIAFEENTPEDVIFSEIPTSEEGLMPCLNLTDKQIANLISARERKETFPSEYEGSRKLGETESELFSIERTGIYQSLLDDIETNPDKGFPYTFTKDSLSNTEFNNELLTGLFKEAESVKINRFCYFYGIVDVKPEYLKPFEKYLMESDNKFMNPYCRLSETSTLYYLDCDLDEKPDIRKYVSAYYELVKYDICQNESTPFFYYKQEDWLTDPIEKIKTPLNVFKEEQMNQKARAKALRLPIKFSNVEKIQIAEYYGFCTHGEGDDEVIINGVAYTCLMNENDTYSFYNADHRNPLTFNDIACALSNGEIQTISFYRHHYRKIEQTDKLLFVDASRNIITAQKLVNQFKAEFDQLLKYYGH